MRWHRLGKTRECHAGIARYLIDGSDLYIWCAGTIGRREWHDNFRTRYVEVDSGVKINSADLHQAIAVLGALKKHVNYGDYRVILAGTSRGFAIASVLAFLMNDEHGKLPELYGWAGKRAGNRRFYDHLKDICIEIQHKAYRFDIVPYMPPWYGATQIEWSKKLLPWRAHEKAFRDAAKWRNEKEQRR